MVHFGQLITAEDVKGNPLFSAYDFGEQENIKHYGQKRPPIWSFDDWNIDTTIIGGDKDLLSTPENIAEILKRIEKKYYTYHNIPNWSHDTPIIPKDPQPLYELIDKALKK